MMKQVTRLLEPDTYVLGGELLWKFSSDFLAAALRAGQWRWQ
jgi:hypothetical protein